MEGRDVVEDILNVYNREDIEIPRLVIKDDQRELFVPSFLASGSGEKTIFTIDKSNVLKISQESLLRLLIGKEGNSKDIVVEHFIELCVIFEQLKMFSHLFTTLSVYSSCKDVPIKKCVDHFIFLIDNIYPVDPKIMSFDNPVLEVLYNILIKRRNEIREDPSSLQVICKKDLYTPLFAEASSPKKNKEGEVENVTTEIILEKYDQFSENNEHIIFKSKSFSSLFDEICFHSRKKFVYESDYFFAINFLLLQPIDIHTGFSYAIPVSLGMLQSNFIRVLMTSESEEFDQWKTGQPVIVQDLRSNLLQFFVECVYIDISSERIKEWAKEIRLHEIIHLLYFTNLFKETRIHQIVMKLLQQNIKIQKSESNKKTKQKENNKNEFKENFLLTILESCGNYEHLSDSTKKEFIGHVTRISGISKDIIDRYIERSIFTNEICKEQFDSFNDRCTTQTTGETIIIQDCYECVTCKMFYDQYDDFKQWCICQNCKEKCHSGHETHYLGKIMCFCQCSTSEDHNCKLVKKKKERKRKRKEEDDDDDDDVEDKDKDNDGEKSLKKRKIE